MAQPGIRQTAAAVREAFGALQPQMGGVSPLVASYWGQAAGQLPPASLPRPTNVYTEGAFTPLSPVHPTAINLPEDDGSILPRRTEQQIGWNLPIGQPGTEGPQAGKFASFQTLRTLAIKDPIVQECIQRRVAEICSFDWDIVPTRAAEKAMKGSISFVKDWQERKAKMVSFWERPDRSAESPYQDYQQFLAAMLNDEFTIDAVAIYLHPPAGGPGKGWFGSNVASLDLIDGSTIRPLYSIHYGKPPPSTPAYQQFIWGIPRMDFASMSAGLDLADIKDTYNASFTNQELLYERYYESTWAPYGMSPVERGLTVIALGIARLSGQLSFYSEGTIPAVYIMPGPEMFQNPQQIRMLQTALNSMAGNIGWKYKVRVLPPNSKIELVKPNPLADQFDELLVAYRTMLFGLTPSDLGVFPNVTQTQAPTAIKMMGQQQVTDVSARWLNPVAKRIERLFNRVIRYVFKQPDMLFSYTGLEEPADLVTKVQILAQQLSTPLNMISLDEARTEVGLEPYGLPETSIPWVQTSSGPQPLPLAMALARAQLDAMQLHGEPVGGVGTTGGTPDRLGPPAAGRQTASGEFTTPLHEGRPRGAFDRDVQGHSSGTPTGHALQRGAQVAENKKAELGQLGRYLERGRLLADFEAEYLSPAVLGTIESTLPAGLKAAMAAGEAQLRMDAENEDRDHAIGIFKAELVPPLGAALKRVARMRVADDAVPDVARSRWQLMTAMKATRERAFKAAGGEGEIPYVAPEIVTTILGAAAKGNLEHAAGMALDEVEFAYSVGELHKGVVSNPPPGTERFLIKYFMEGAGGRIRWGTPGDFMACTHIAERHLPGKTEQAHAFCQHLHYMTTGRPAGHAPAELAMKEASGKAALPTIDFLALPAVEKADSDRSVVPHSAGPGAPPSSESPPERKAAGIALRARDTGRVLMLQRANDDGDPNAGKIEFPGGRLEDGETPFEAAKREWQEEVGVKLPKDAEQVGSWTSPDGSYEGHILTCDSEDCVPPRQKPKIDNPDDPDGDHIEALNWWEPHEVANSPSLRPEVRQSPWHMIGSADLVGKATAPPTGQPNQQQQRKRRAPPPPPPFLIPHYPATSAAPTWTYDLQIAEFYEPLIRAALAVAGMAGLVAILAALYADAHHVGREVALGHDVTVEPGTTPITPEAEASAERAVQIIKEDVAPVDMATDTRAELIATTEAMRAMREGAIEVYRAAGVLEYDWKTMADAQVCPACIANAEGSPYALDAGPEPPEHPRCRCWIVPHAS